MKDQREKEEGNAKCLRERAVLHNIYAEYLWETQPVIGKDALPIRNLGTLSKQKPVDWLLLDSWTVKISWRKGRKKRRKAVSLKYIGESKKILVFKIKDF